VNPLLQFTLNIQCHNEFSVVFVDGLDTCEHEKMLHTLDAINVLFCSKQNSLFIVFLAGRVHVIHGVSVKYFSFINKITVDPHIVVTAVQKNMGSIFTRTDLNGHDYLKNLIQMPFYLHNSAMQRLHDKLSQYRRESFDYLRWKVHFSRNIIFFF